MLPALGGADQHLLRPAHADHTGQFLHRAEHGKTVDAAPDARRIAVNKSDQTQAGIPGLQNLLGDPRPRVIGPDDQGAHAGRRGAQHPRQQGGEHVPRTEGKFVHRADEHPRPAGEDERQQRVEYEDRTRVALEAGREDDPDDKRHLGHEHGPRDAPQIRQAGVAPHPAIQAGQEKKTELEGHGQRQKAQHLAEEIRGDVEFEAQQEGKHERDREEARFADEHEVEVLVPQHGQRKRRELHQASLRLRWKRRFTFQ
ncbi:hypothetical protein DSECCO2_451670 [anaerobic digester metagenome]